MIDFGKYEAMSFDCYGTLIDWEDGLISGIKPILERHGVGATDEEILALHARTESGLQSVSEGGAYVKYKKVLGDTVLRFGEEYGFESELSEVGALADSLRYWESFPDAVEAPAENAATIAQRVETLSTASRSSRVFREEVEENLCNLLRRILHHEVPGTGDEI